MGGGGSARLSPDAARGAGAIQQAVRSPHGRSPHRLRLEELYERASCTDAVVLLLALRICDDAPPQEWPERIRALGGPQAEKARVILRRLGIEEV